MIIIKSKKTLVLALLFIIVAQLLVFYVWQNKEKASGSIEQLGNANNVDDVDDQLVTTKNGQLVIVHKNRENDTFRSQSLIIEGLRLIFSNRTK